jgi:hypothetical protein
MHGYGGYMDMGPYSCMDLWGWVDPIYRFIHIGAMSLDDTCPS